MEYKRDMIMLAVLSVVMILFSVAGIVWAFASQLVFGGLDGILLLAVCLMVGGVFTLELWLVARQAGWVPSGVPATGAGKSAALSAPVTKSAAVGATAAPALSKDAPPAAAVVRSTPPPQTAALSVPLAGTAPANQPVVAPALSTVAPSPAAPDAAPPVPEPSK
jgi:hypothetical protein